MSQWGSALAGNQENWLSWLPKDGGRLDSPATHIRLSFYIRFSIPKLPLGAHQFITAIFLVPFASFCVLLRPEESLTPAEQAILAKIQKCCPELAQARALANDFGTLVRERGESRLSGWLLAAGASDVTEMKSFASGLLKDESAVRAALSMEWSNGPVEGQVNRLKFVKRSMYGRGGFALLRARVLHRHAALKHRPEPIGTLAGVLSLLWNSHLGYWHRFWAMSVCSKPGSDYLKTGFVVVSS